MDNRERALQVFAVASLLEARGANPYRVRAYRRAAVRLLTLPADATAYLDARGELDLPGLGQRLRRKLGELTRTGRLAFHDELIAALPRPVRTLMTVPGIGPRTAERLVDELHVRGLKSLARAARRGRLQALRGVGETREQRWGASAELLLRGQTPPPASPLADPNVVVTPIAGAVTGGTPPPSAGPASAQPVLPGLNRAAGAASEEPAAEPAADSASEPAAGPGRAPTRAA